MACVRGPGAGRDLCALRSRAPGALIPPDRRRARACLLAAYAEHSSKIWREPAVVSPNAVRIALPLRAQVHRFFGAICALCRLATAALMLPSWSFTRTSSTRCSHAPRMRVARTESHTSAIDDPSPGVYFSGIGPAIQPYMAIQYDLARSRPNTPIFSSPPAAGALDLHGNSPPAEQRSARERRNGSQPQPLLVEQPLKEKRLICFAACANSTGPFWAGGPLFPASSATNGADGHTRHHGITAAARLDHSRRR
jgi:hypothetical protein